MKKCPNCKQIKELSEFYFDSYHKKYRYNCKNCQPTEKPMFPNVPKVKLERVATEKPMDNWEKEFEKVWAGELDKVWRKEQAEYKQKLIQRIEKMFTKKWRYKLFKEDKDHKYFVTCGEEVLDEVEAVIKE